MLSVTLTDCDLPLAIILIVLSLGLNGAATVSNLQNFHDLSPMFAATLFGIVKSIDSITGFITPCVTAVITLNKVSTTFDGHAFGNNGILCSRAILSSGIWFI